ncbi:MAG: hypothetical protein RSB67_03625 [Clostridia bacterium]
MKTDKIRIKIDGNNYEKSDRIKRYILKYLEKFEIVSIVENPPFDYIFIIGGDGTFLNSFSKDEFDKNTVFVGINSGSLGYIQDVSNDDLDTLLKKIEKIVYYITNFKRKSLNLQKAYYLDVVFTTNEKIIHKKALNEVIIVGDGLKKISFDLFSNGTTLKSKKNGHKVNSSGICFATPLGSTGFSKSNNGPIILEPNITLIVQTLINPIFNAKYGSFLSNPTISKKYKVVFDECTNVPSIVLDGNNIEIFNLKKVELSIESYILKTNCEEKSMEDLLREKLIP